MMRTILFFLLLFPLLNFAQENEKHEKIRQLKIAFITSEINLSAEDAAKFWPIYNEAENEIHEIKKSSYAAYSKYIKGKNESEINEADAKKFIEILNENETKIVEIKEKRYHNLGKSISYKKIIRLRKVEEDFKQKLLEQYKKKK